MCVNIANPDTEESLLPNEAQDFLVGCHCGLRQTLQGIKDHIAFLQTTQCQFTGYKGMRQDAACIQMRFQFGVPLPQMVYPDRRIDQNHVGSDWRRGTLSTNGSDPPSKASRLALSR
jgi:hypothetical protein